MSSFRLGVRVDSWTPSEEQWQKALSLLGDDLEIARIAKFQRPLADGVRLVGRTNLDAKASLIGRLLLKYVVHEQLGIPYDKIAFERTKEGKPFLAESCLPYQSKPLSNFNFNVSHHGDWVLIASESNRLIGVDVMRSERERKNTITEYFKLLHNTMTPFEWVQINGTFEDEDEDRLDRFYTFWCLKESYIKAVGIGLGFELLRMTFSVRSFEKTLGRIGTASLTLDKQVCPQWTFDIEWLDDTHVTAVALGPIDEALHKNVVSNRRKESESDKNANAKTGFPSISPDELISLISGC